jgi:hypothetical protein
MKEDGKIKKTISLFNRGWKDFEKISKDSGAALATVKTQYYKYRKVHGEPKVGAKK